MSTFAERFKLARERVGLPLAKVAERIRVSTQAAWNYENRPDGSVSVDLLFPLADALGVEARWLAMGDGVMVTGDRPSAEQRRVEKLARGLAALKDDRLQALSVLLGIELEYERQWTKQRVVKG